MNYRKRVHDVQVVIIKHDVQKLSELDRFYTRNIYGFMEMIINPSTPSKEIIEQARDIKESMEKEYSAAGYENPFVHELDNSLDFTTRMTSESRGSSLDGQLEQNLNAYFGVINK